MKRRQLTAWGLAAMMGLMTMAGCGAPSRENTGTDTSSTDGGGSKETKSTDGDVVELTFTGWEASPLETEAVKNGIEIFEQQHPNIKVNYTSGLSGAEYTAKLLTSAASNTLPDVMFMQSIDYRTFASKGIIMDVTDKFDSEFPLDDFIDSSRQIMDINGKVYGVSSCTVQPIIYYNKDLFDEAGVEYPSSDPENCWTIDEFREVAKKLTHDDIYGCYGMELDGMWPALTNANGGHYFNEDYTEPNFNTPENKEIFEIIKAIREEDGSSPDASTLDNVGMTAVQMLQTGKIGMLCDGSWALQEIAASGMNVGMAPLPSFKQASSSGQAHLHCISSQTKHPEEAWEFVKFLSSEEYQGSLIKSGLWMPNRHSWYTEDGQKKWYDEKVHGEDYKQMLSYFEDAEADERAFQLTTKCADSIKEEMELFFKEGKDIDAALQDAEARMKEAMDEISAE